MSYRFNKQINLSECEIEMLQWFAHGKSGEEIALIQNITVDAVYSKMTKIKNKLGASTTTGAVCMVMREGKIK